MTAPDYISPNELLGDVLSSNVDETRAVVISTLGGSAALQGNTHELGNDTDSDLLLGVREWADAVIVGSSSVKAEDYGPCATTPIAIVTASLSIAPEHPALHSPTATPGIVLTPQSSLDDANNHDTLSALHDAGVSIISTGDGSATSITNALHEAGFHRLTLEGGPSLFRQFMAAKAVDVLHLTMQPSVTIDDNTSIFSHATKNEQASATQWQLEEHAATSDGLLFLRYRRMS